MRIELVYIPKAVTPIDPIKCCVTMTLTRWTVSARVRTSLSRTATCCKGQFVDPKRSARLIGRASNQLKETKKRDIRLEPNMRVHVCYS